MRGDDRLEGRRLGFERRGVALDLADDADAGAIRGEESGRRRQPRRDW